MDELIGEYLPPTEAGVRLRELELIVQHLLSHLAAGHVNVDREADRVVAEVGFVDAIRQGSVVVEPGR